MNGCGFETPVNQQQVMKTCYKDINVYYQNVRGLRTKLSTFYLNILESPYDLFAITESSLHRSIHDGELIPPGFQIVRCDRADGRKHGGVFLASSSSLELRCVPVGNVDTALFEIVCATVHRDKKLMFLCCVVYIPPHSVAREYMQLFLILENVCVKYNNVIVLGDFNMPSAPVEMHSYMEYFNAACGFCQVNNVRNINNRTLDLVFTTFLARDVEVKLCNDPLVDIDVQHPPVYVSVTMGTAREPQAQRLYSRDEIDKSFIKRRWNFYKANFHILYDSFQQIDWGNLYQIDTPEVAISELYTVVNEVIDRLIPRARRAKLNRNHSRYVYPEWYSSDLIRDIKRKWRYHKLYKMTGAQCDYEAFSRYRSQIKHKLKVNYEAYQEKLQLNFKDDPKSFWDYVRCKQSKRNKPRVTKNGLELSESSSAQCFASYFQTVYSETRPALDPEAAERAASARAGAARVHVGQLSVRDIRTALARLKPKRSVGPDGIPPYIVKDCRSVFEKPLLHVFNLCLREGYYPEEWKLTRVIPVPKGGSNSDVSGYRPVAVLSAFAKVFESALQKCIYTQISSQLTDVQHGFRPGRSTASNLLSFMTYLTPVIDAGGQVDAAYFDFRKAFDTVDNDILLEKFAAVGFTPHLLKFFASYLGERRQYVEFAGYESEPYFTFSGVSQGSNLGPLEFILLINDLPEVIKDSKCLLFADDLKLFLSVADVSDCEQLQRDIDRVVQWSAINKLYFNTSKCEVISYGRRQAPLQYRYEVDGTVMPRVSFVHDLGVQIVAELTFRRHIEDTCGKAFRNLGFILRNCRDYLSTAIIKVLYNALVRSRLETSAIIWNPHEDKYINMVEKIQNKFTRFLYLKEYGVYPFYPLMYPSLFVIGMVGYSQLGVRRDVALCKYVWSVLRGQLYHPEVLEALQLFVPDKVVVRRRPHPTFKVPHARTNLLRFAPMSRALKLLNIISEETDIFHCSLAKFTEAAHRVCEIFS
ncbi:unnamed protein product [Parnassius mnemosyne]|uniref:Reverse transcriptase domain-containing protein n=1 Tax=Parnassius mnemosyne TaxID=213953 RepID=A0AAV1KPW1_9NEOP